MAEHFQLDQNKTLKSSEMHLYKTIKKQRSGTQKRILCEPTLNPKAYFIILLSIVYLQYYTQSLHGPCIFLH